MRRYAAVVLGLVVVAGAALVAALERDAEATSEWGVEPVGLRLTGAGYLLDLRFRVLDAQRAAGLLDRRRALSLRVAGDGTLLRVPSGAKVGPLRQTVEQPREGKVYYSLFANPGRRVRSGEAVEVLMDGRLVAELEVK